MISVIVDAKFAAAAAAPEQLPPPTQLEIAFAGRSNVGKSSLLNAVMKRRNLARTSSTPGCTRGIIFFDVRTREGQHLSLVDLPGYGYASRSKTEKEGWANLIESYILTRPTLRAVALLVDVRRGLETHELELLKMLAEPVRNRPPLEHVLIATKLDKLPASQRRAALAQVGKGHQVAGFSTELPETADEVWNRLFRAARAKEDAPPA